MEEFVLLKLVGEAVKIMCQVNPKYENFVVIENGKKVHYLQLLKAFFEVSWRSRQHYVPGEPQLREVCRH
jgi:hypothetical protein